MLLQRQSIKPLTTAHLAQTMTLLELTGEELKQRIEAELSKNPALELVDHYQCPNCKRRLAKPSPCPICSIKSLLDTDQPIVFISPKSDFTTYDYRSTDSDLSIEDITIAREDLPSYLMRQIAPEIRPVDRKIAAHILTSLDEDGLLTVPIAEIANYLHVGLNQVQEVIQIIQKSDPIGVGSQSPQEALLVQLEYLAENTHVPEQAKQAILYGMDLLSRHSYHELGKLLQISTIEARWIAQFISENLNPYPARAYWGDSNQELHNSQTIHAPDIILSISENSPSTTLIVEIASPYAGALRINPLFRQAIAEVPEEKSVKWKEELEQAILLIKCLQQRNNTLVRMMKKLAVVQRDYILKGDLHLVPITRAELADELNVHESTISRAVSDKMVQLPNRRIIPLSKMFDRSLHIRAEIRRIISQENKPLSDAKIAKLLEKRGYSVARRTVAKYRSMEGILSARLR